MILLREMYLMDRITEDRQRERTEGALEKRHLSGTAAISLSLCLVHHCAGLSGFSEAWAGRLFPSYWQTHTDCLNTIASHGFENGCPPPSAPLLWAQRLEPRFPHHDTRIQPNRHTEWTRTKASVEGECKKRRKGASDGEKRRWMENGGKIDRPRSPFVPSLNFSFCLILNIFPPSLFRSNPWSFTKREKESVIKREKK